jgi:hypothetical protein
MLVISKLQPHPCLVNHRTTHKLIHVIIEHDLIHKKQKLYIPNINILVPSTPKCVY